MVHRPYLQVGLQQLYMHHSCLLFPHHFPPVCAQDPKGWTHTPHLHLQEDTWSALTESPLHCTPGESWKLVHLTIDTGLWSNSVQTQKAELRPVSEVLDYVTISQVLVPMHHSLLTTVSNGCECFQCHVHQPIVRSILTMSYKCLNDTQVTNFLAECFCNEHKNISTNTTK